MTFDSAVNFVLSAEGGFSDDSQDAGGQTKFGISKHGYPDVDIPNLTREQAVDIYKRDFWDRLQCGELPHGLDIVFFDCAINQGPVPAVRMLQNALKVTADGIMGAITIRAAQNAPDVLQEFLARRMYAYSVIPQVLRYGLGWFRRIASVSALAHKPQ